MHPPAPSPPSVSYLPNLVIPPISLKQRSPPYMDKQMPVKNFLIKKHLQILLFTLIALFIIKRTCYLGSSLVY